MRKKQKSRMATRRIVLRRFKNDFYSCGKKMKKSISTRRDPTNEKSRPVSLPIMKKLQKGTFTLICTSLEAFVDYEQGWSSRGPQCLLGLLKVSINTEAHFFMEDLGELWGGSGREKKRRGEKEKKRKERDQKLQEYEKTINNAK